jgi:hypothetical protein
MNLVDLYINQVKERKKLCMANEIINEIENRCSLYDNDKLMLTLIIPELIQEYEIESFSFDSGTETHYENIEEALQDLSFIKGSIDIYILDLKRYEIINYGDDPPSGVYYFNNNRL